MNKKAIIAIGILIIVVAGVLFWMLRQDNTNDNNAPANTSSDAPATSTPNDSATEPATQTTITYSDSGFSPNSVTVQSGETVTVKNTSSHTMQFNSGPHPAHTANPELNVGSVPSGESMDFVVETKGTFGYHNHLNASQKGTIIVE